MPMEREVIRRTLQLLGAGEVTDRDLDAVIWALKRYPGKHHLEPRKLHDPPVKVCLPWFAEQFRERVEVMLDKIAWENATRNEGV